MGGKGGSNLAMAVIRDHLAAKGLGLHNERSIVGNNPFILLFKGFATAKQYARDGEAVMSGKMRAVFGLTEPNHGADATCWKATPESRPTSPKACMYRCSGATIQSAVPPPVMTIVAVSDVTGASSTTIVIPK